jgi:hypothetical protein
MPLTMMTLLCSWRGAAKAGLRITAWFAMPAESYAASGYGALVRRSISFCGMSSSREGSSKKAVTARAAMEGLNSD